MKKIHHHFSTVAHKYRDLRTTDLAPILFINKKLKKLSKIKALDIGCGAGRYDLKLFNYLGNRLHLICIDVSGNMLKNLKGHLRKNKIKSFETIKAKADELPLKDSSLDCIFTFNAAHLFKLLDFLKEVSRTLKKNGYLFIYTRLRKQNKRNIWGRYFPKFNRKETRLYELDELKETLKKVSGLKLESIEYFKYRRNSHLSWLEEKLSTFAPHRQEYMISFYFSLFSQ